MAEYDEVGIADRRLCKTELGGIEIEGMATEEVMGV
jgi:hypothetical protein